MDIADVQTKIAHLGCTKWLWDLKWSDTTLLMYWATLLGGQVVNEQLQSSGEMA